MNKSIKIAYCIPSTNNSGGMERILTQKANYLADKAGAEILIITTSQKGRTFFFPLSPRIRTIDIGIDYEEMTRMPLAKRIKARIKAKKIHRNRLENILNAEHPDITVSMFTHEMSFLPKIKDGSKKVLEIHFSKNFRNLDARYNHQSKLLRIINRFLDFHDRKAIRHYDKFIVLSHRDAKDWGDSYKNIEVISNPTAFNVGSSSQSLEKKIMAVGRLCPQKGFDMLVDIWNRIEPSVRKEWTLEIFGSGPDEEMLRNKISNSGLASNIILLPPTKNIQKEYQSHSIFAFPSRYEGFPLALIEAMTYGMGVVSFDCPCGPSELIPDTEHGMLIPAYDIEQFAEGLTKLMNNDDERRLKGKNASQYIKSNFSEEAIMNKWITLFDNLLTHKKL